MNPYEASTAFLTSIAFMATAAILVGIAGYLTIATLWRFSHQPAPGTLGALFARQGVDWNSLAARVTIEEFARYQSRCRECGAKARCGEWLAAGGATGYESFCPNAAFVERVTKSKMR